MIQDDLSRHVERARAELDAAYRATDRDSANDHLRRCAFHMRAARSARSEGERAEVEWIERCAPLHERTLAASTGAAAIAMTSNAAGA